MPWERWPTCTWSWHRIGHMGWSPVWVRGVGCAWKTAMWWPLVRVSIAWRALRWWWYRSWCCSGIHWRLLCEDTAQDLDHCCQVWTGLQCTNICELWTLGFSLLKLTRTQMGDDSSTNSQYLAWICSISLKRWENILCSDASTVIIEGLCEREAYQG